MKELQKDITEECEEEIKDKLYNWARANILRQATRGMPEWYKQKLLDKQFEDQCDNNES